MKKSSTFSRCSGRIAGDLSRRSLLQNSSAGFGWLALNGLLAGDASSNEFQAPRTHFPARAKNIIFCFMDGGPSHVDTFDPKPMLKKHEGKAIGDGAVSKRSQSAASRVWLGSPWEFQQRGKSGLWVSDLFPHISQVADEICVVRSMIGELPLHGQQNLLLHTGRILGQAPSLGAWVSYGLGSENKNLPGYVVLNNDWSECEVQLLKYLVKGTSPELQMGAVSGLADIQSEQVVEPLIQAVTYLPARNRKLAIEALVRTEPRALELIKAIKASRITVQPEELKLLLEHKSEKVKKASASLK